MDSDTSSEKTVLIVDDDPGLAATFATWLRDEYAIRETHHAEQARTKLDEDVDIVLLDRRMPETSGDELLEEIRESDLDVRVGMLTAVPPDVDVIDLTFDEYAVKPVNRGELLALVQSLERRLTYSDRLQQLYSLATKRAVLLDAKHPEELADSPRFAELTRRLEECRAEVDSVLNEFDDDEYDVAFQMILDE